MCNIQNNSNKKTPIVCQVLNGKYKEIESYKKNSHEMFSTKANIHKYLNMQGMVKINNM